MINPHRANRPTLNDEEHRRLVDLARRESIYRFGTAEPPGKVMRRLKFIAARMKDDHRLAKMEGGWASRRIAAEKAFADSVVALENAGLQVDLDQFREAKDGHLGFAFSGITYCGKKYVEVDNGKPRFPNLNYVDAFAKQMRGTPEGQHITKILQDWKRTHLPLAIERNRHFQRQMDEMVVAARAMGKEELAKRFEKRSIWDQGEVMNRLDLFATEFLNGVGVGAEQYRR